MEIFHFSWGIRTQTGDILICLTKPIHTYSCTVHEYMQFICQCCMQSITGFWLVTIPANKQTSRSQGMGICAPGCETYRDSGSLNCIEMTSVSHLPGGSSKNVQDIWEGAGSHYALYREVQCYIGMCALHSKSIPLGWHWLIKEVSPHWVVLLKKDKPLCTLYSIHSRETELDFHHQEYISVSRVVPSLDSYTQEVIFRMFWCIHWHCHE